MRPILAFVPIAPSALTPTVWLWLHHNYGPTPQGSALCNHLTVLYAVATAALAIAGRAWMTPKVKR